MTELHRVRHSGSYAFPQPIEVDFDQLGLLIAVTGSIGQGKTTLLDLFTAATWMEMAFRPGPLHRNFVARGSVDFEWSHAGARYRSDVKVDPKSERVEGNLYRLAPDPAHLAGPLARDFKKKVEEILGPMETAIASMYAVQNGEGSFLKLKPAWRRDLFMDILKEHLADFPEHEEHCKDKAKLLAAKLTALRGRIQTLETKAAERSGLEADHAGANLALAQAREELAAAEQTARSARADEAEARQVLAVLTPKSAELKRLETQLVEVQEKLKLLLERRKNNKAVLDRATEISKAVQEDGELKDRLAAIDRASEEKKALDGKIAALETKLTAARADLKKHRELLDSEEDIRAAAKTLGEVDQEIAGLEAEKTAAKNTYVADLQLHNLAVQRRQERNAKEQWRKKHAEDAAGIQAVPCHGDGEYAGCAFLATAIKARDELLPRVETEIAAIVVTEDDLTEPVDGSVAIEAKRVLARAHRDVLSPTADRLGALEGARTAATTIESQISADELALQEFTQARALAVEVIAGRDSLVTRRAALAPDVAYAPKLEQATARLEELAGPIAEQEAQVLTLDGQIANLQLAIAGIPTLEAAITRALNAAVSAESSTKTRRGEVDQLVGKLGGLSAKLDEVGRADGDLEGARAEIPPIEDDLADWTLLQRVYSPVGYPALLIDERAKGISRIATEMLRECYGAELFTIDLITQKPTSDEKKLIETLEIRVTRNGREVEANVLSGGEQALLSEAVSLGFALYQATSSSRRYQTLLRDEVTAPLGPEIAIAYVNMLRRAAKLGGFTRVLFVTHQPKCAELADTRLAVAGGRITIA